MKKIIILSIMCMLLVGCGKEEVAESGNTEMESSTEKGSTETIEAEQENASEENVEVIKEKNYTIGNDYFVISLSQKEDVPEIVVCCTIEDEANAAYACITLHKLLSDEELKKLNPSFMAFNKASGKSIMYFSKSSVLLGFDGENKFDVGEWSANALLNDVGEKEKQTSYSNEIIGIISDFFEIENPTKESVLLYEDEKVKLYYDGTSENGVVFSIENMTNANITIQADTISINGESINEIIMSDDVAPQSKGEVTARCDLDKDIEVSTVGGQLKIIDFDDSFKTYNVKFINIPIKQ